MEWRGAWCASPATDYPNRLAEPGSPALRWRWGVLLFLLLLCLVPRAGLAWQCSVFWGDVLIYLRSTEAIEQGRLDDAFRDLGLNAYPVLLWTFRQLPWDWAITGQCWSVALASLTVLPLFGWVRRQFDDRVAVAACVAYAFHGKLLAVSPLIIRDPTFWFLFTLTIYLMWRAIVEIRISFFVAAAAVLGLAIHTRTEGWLLLVPPVLWVACRYRSAVQRLRLVAGLLLCLAAIPLSVTVVNLTWLREHPRWEMLRPQHITIVGNWLRGREEPSPQAPLVAAVPAVSPATTPTPIVPPTLAPAPRHFSHFALHRKLAGRMVKEYTYVGAALTLLGVWGWRRTFFRRDHLAMLAMVLLLLVVIRIRYSQLEIDTRYFLPMVIVSTPWMALGFFRLAQIVQAFPLAWNDAKRCVLLGGLAIALAAGSAVQSRLPAARAMKQQVELGQWVLEHRGPHRTLNANQDTALLQYFAEGQLGFAPPPPRQAGDPLGPTARGPQADVILIWPEEKDRERWDAYVEALSHPPQAPYQRVDPDLLPPDCRDVAVLVRREK